MYDHASVDQELRNLRARVETLEIELAEKEEFIDIAFELHPDIGLDVELNKRGLRKSEARAITEATVFGRGIHSIMQQAFDEAARKDMHLAQEIIEDNRHMIRVDIGDGAF